MREVLEKRAPISSAVLAFRECILKLNTYIPLSINDMGSVCSNQIRYVRDKTENKTVRFIFFVSLPVESNIIHVN